MNGVLEGETASHGPADRPNVIRVNIRPCREIIKRRFLIFERAGYWQTALQFASFGSRACDSPSVEVHGKYSVAIRCQARSLFS